MREIRHNFIMQQNQVYGVKKITVIFMLCCFVKQNETKVRTCYAVLAYKKQPVSPTVLKNQQYLQQILLKLTTPK